MPFPRNADNTLNFNTFIKLSTPDQVLAFSDLKANGTVAERREFQQWKANLAKVVDLKKQLVANEAEARKLDAELIEHRKELAFGKRQINPIFFL